MSARQTFVIVGASLAGARAAGTLREEGFDGRVVLVGEEAERPYSRPSLSKAYLAGKKERPSVVYEDSFYEERAIELRTSTRVTAVDRAAAEVELEDGERIGYDGLLLATGALPRPLPVPGAELDEVLMLRRVGDSDAIRERIDRGARFVVIGGGWIGAEVAATARSRGCEVAMIFPEDVPLERVLGTEIGGWFAKLHEAQGVELHAGAGVAALEGSGSVERVRLADGRALEADVVVVGIGVVPRVELAEQAGIAVSNGIDVDARFRTSDEKVFAAGDVAAVEHAFFGERIRVEHWAVANDHGPFVARSMLGSDTAYDTLPYFFSDQFDASLEYWGYAREWDEVVIRGDESSFVAFWLKDGRVLAGAGLNSPGVGEAIEALIRSRRQVDRGALADPGVALGGDAEELPELAPGEGVVLERGEDSLAVARDAGGELHVLSAVCTHLGCIVGWDAEEQTWDCHCHGSRFAIDGRVINGPAEEPLPGRAL